MTSSFCLLLTFSHPFLGGWGGQADRGCSFSTSVLNKRDPKIYWKCTPKVWHTAYFKQMQLKTSKLSKAISIRGFTYLTHSHNFWKVESLPSILTQLHGQTHQHREGVNNPMVHISAVFPGSRGLLKAVYVGHQASSRPSALKHPCCELGFPSSLPTGCNTDHRLLASFYSPINLKLPKSGNNLLVLHLHIFQLTIPITYSNAQTQWLPAGPSTAGHLFVLLYSVYVQGRGFWWGVQAQPLLHKSHGILPYTSIKLQLQHTMTGYSSLF